MNRLLFSIYRVLVPKPARTAILKRNLRKKILAQLSSAAQISAEEDEVMRHLRNNPVSIFPYPFSSDYSPDLIEVYFDEERKMRYVLQDGKKLYFKRRWGAARIRRAYADLAREQDENSPHRYLSDTFTLGKSDTVADIGAAEGNFSLSVIENVARVILVESDIEWIDALRATFEPWKEKVTIVDKYLSDSDDDGNITLDSMMALYPGISFFKIDVDGFEDKVLKGAALTLSSGCPLKIALCTYHKHDDEKIFSDVLTESGFMVTPSRGFMIHYYDKKLRSPWLRR